MGGRPAPCGNGYPPTWTSGFPNSRDSRSQGSNQAKDAGKPISNGDQSIDALVSSHFRVKQHLSETTVDVAKGVIDGAWSEDAIAALCGSKEEEERDDSICNPEACFTCPSFQTTPRS